MNWIYSSGYFFAFLMFAAAVFLLFTAKSKHYIKTQLIVTFSMIAVWSAVFAASFTALLEPSLSLLMYLDHVKNAAWIFFLTAVLNSEISNIKTHLQFRFVRYAIGTIFITLIISGIATYTFDTLIPIVHFAFPLLVCTLQLALIEQWYRKSDEASRWQFKPMILAISTMSVFDFFLYSEALLLKTINLDYVAARGFIYAAIVPFILISIKRTTNWGIRIFISRDIVLQSSMVVGAGAYLMLMAVVGFYIKQSGAAWSGVVQISFVVIAFALLIALFLSGSLRKNIKVYITKHFFANQYDYREEWLRLIHTLNTHKESEHNFYEVGIKGMMQAINYNYGSYLSITDKNLLRPVASINMNQISIKHVQLIKATLAFIRQHHWMIDLNEYSRTPKNYPELIIDPELLDTSTFSLIVPMFNDDKLQGVFLLHTQKDKQITLNWETRDYLTAVTAQVGSFYRVHQSGEQLRENAQFDAFNRMSAFVMHDLKNVVAQITLILDNAEKHKHNPEFIDDTFETLQHTRQRMNKMLDQLLNKNVSNTAQQDVDLKQLIQDIVVKLSNIKPIPELKTPDEIVNLVIDKDKLTNVLTHLIDNAQQATEDSGTVIVELEQQAYATIIIITDTGCGMTQEFIAERLFKPFDTTKGNAGMGIGAYDAKAFMEQLGGDLLVTSKPDVGTTFKLIFPHSNQMELTDAKIAHC
ncbi:XrtA/PEP-CTERM system histidine kinase PrsK [Flocculibacter collagenilyticus]|uniref:XrtA/PEP-CTERM system histidine kinase PrsK n=1 Tax=Flocculibacter collagenilyticus TaxID=2744479 RepID=UPI0018F4F4D3|nr:XrtA/PEP-CTERM system histidine kinase PrsK [Flocculibacter collagenilyticus]